MLWPVVKALLGHYRRYPLQILLVWLGLTLGGSFLVGVTSVNQYARTAYEHGERLFDNPLPYRIRPNHMTSKIPQGFYIQLRQKGFQQCVPFENTKVRLANGHELMIVGIDPVAMLQFHSAGTLNDRNTFQLMQAPYPLMVSRDLANHMGWKNGELLTLHNGQPLGSVLIAHNEVINGVRVIADIALLRQLDHSAGFSMIACGRMTEDKLSRLKQALPNGMVLTRHSYTELESLTDAFHSNLSAMGMLSFVVGLFIFYQAMSLSFVQRQPLVGILRQAGVSGWQLTLSLLFELWGFILASWVCSNLFGMMLANQLLPSVSASLGDLYGANVGLDIHWSWQASSYSLLMIVLGAGLACVWPSIRLLRAQPIRLTARLSLVRFAGEEFTLQALIACALCVAAVAIYQAPQTQPSGFAVIICMLLCVAFFTPFIIWRFFLFFSQTMRWVKVRWFFADAAASMSYRGVATMGFMLAMAANIGIETMVGSFRDTADHWLTQRLAADIYLYPNMNSAARMNQWLEAQPEVKEVWWRWEKEIPANTGLLQVVSTGHSQGEQAALTVKAGMPNYWTLLQRRKQVMISESMAIKMNIHIGERIDLSSPLGKGWQVVGIYYDYGNPYNQVLISHDNWQQAFKEAGNASLGVVLYDGADRRMLKHRLVEQFNLNADRLFDNSRLHQQAMTLFDRTFSIAETLGNLTLVIAVFGIFFATLGGETSRQRHISLLRCLGVSGKELVATGCLQLFVLGTLAIFIAMPLGLALAHLIVEMIIRPAFGWTLTLRFIPEVYVQSLSLAMLTLMLAGTVPVLRMVRNTPMKSLRDAL